MSSPSSSTSQPPSAQLGTLRSPSRRPSAPPSEGDGSDNSIMSSHENAENDREASLGADSEIQRAPPLSRRRVLDYVPRRRNNDELREV
ncbi:hypothetical protein E4U61_005038, partial [Claviceps capensis]